MTLSQMLQAYDDDHRHPANRALHLAGITMIGSGVFWLLPLPPLGLSLVTLGWAAQLTGHAIEGKRPSFTRDRRYMAVGAVWYAREVKRLLRARSA